MEKSFTLPLCDGYVGVPVIELYGIPMVIRPGITVPVFPSAILKETFRSEPVIRDVIMEFPPWEVRGDVHSIPEFCLGPLRFRPLEVFVPEKAGPDAPVMLSTTMFNGTAVGFDQIEGRFTVTMDESYALDRSFRVRAKNGMVCPQEDKAGT